MSPAAGGARRPGIVHLGIGAFARAHLAWYTQTASDDGGAPWGIVAFTGRSPGAAEALTAQDCRYTLVTRSAAGDEATPMDVVVAAHAGSDASAWRHAVASPETAIVTLTVTENGYGAGSSVVGRLVDGLRARHTAGGGALTVMSLDNLTGNGTELRRSVLSAIDEDRAVDTDLAAWVEATVTFPNSMVDRITPATTPADVEAVAELPGAVQGDRIPVITEPFTEWVISDDFAGDRPAWETAGARIVADVGPYEDRKLWLLNGAHSLMAYLGLVLGHETIADAFADPRCRDAVEDLWDEAEAELRLPSDAIADARAALRDRFANPRIRHTLRQVAADGSTKLPVRIGAPLARRLERDPTAGIGPGTATLVAAWWVHCTTQPALVSDPGAPGPDASIEDAVRIALPGVHPASLIDGVRAAADRIARISSIGTTSTDTTTTATTEGAPA